MELQGKVAFVTGGGRGIGRETCILLAKHGAKVAVFSRSQTEVAETANYIIEELGGEAILRNRGCVFRRGCKKGDPTDEIHVRKR